jgi:hypothetical protein
MQIPEVKITVAEMKDAISTWLKTRGIDLPIISVESFGFPIKGYSIELDESQKVEVATAEAEAPLV